MNNWNNEYMAEYHRQDLIREAEQIRREKLGIHSHVYHPGFFTRIMFNVGNWMISKGKQLRKRYEIPTAACNNTPSGSFAR
jgi:hypothetical protein